MEEARPENPNVLWSHNKGALGRTPPETSHQFDLEVRVVAELLLDIYEFHQKRRIGGGFGEPRLDGVRPPPKI
jgi:hypothetical protein